MTGKTTWKIPDLRRAIRVAHSQGLLVTGCNINRDGSLHIAVQDCTLRSKVTPGDEAEAGEAA